MMMTSGKMTLSQKLRYVPLRLMVPKFGFRGPSVSCVIILSRVKHGLAGTVEFIVISYFSPHELRYHIHVTASIRVIRSEIMILGFDLIS